MKQIERAPKWINEQLNKEVHKLRLNDEFQSLVNDINEKYLYWDKAKYNATNLVSEPKVLWAAIKLSRTINAKKIQFGEHKFFYNLTDFIQKELHEFDLHIGGHLGTRNLIPEDDKKRYLVSSIMEEAIASSQIEGAVTTRKQAKEMLRKNIKPKNKSEQMILNNYITIKHIVEIKDEPITTERFLEIHRLISSQTLPDTKYEGKYRKDNEIKVIDVVNGNIVHSPPDYREISKLLNDVFIFFNNDKNDQFIHPIIKGCIIHFMIGFIHPFVDGNGRTARALFYWYLLKNGYWLTEYLSISRLIVKSKAQYARAYQYTEMDDNDLTYFINYKIKTMEMAFDSLREYIQLKINEKRKGINFQRIKGINTRQAEIIKWIFEEPNLMFSVKEIENRLTISNQTARTDLTELVNRGYLEIINLNNKTKGFCRTENFENILKKELPKKII
ncbi:MAG TPA: cell filamentation protein Fic [Bacteroidales bacterium]|nr:MAG: cell filamentation protein Fic [Bacteroidetes bacterium GWF2_35_48]OFZ04710.1 MAG: cell filamentation protein Fic [Bacteroidetes bacterium RIFOXYC12_FULL_35_7]HBX51225.1 cell filamentation protein Fic [Bacteroidales bacterium]